MRCLSCSAEMADLARFCPSCGTLRADGDEHTLVHSRTRDRSSGSLGHGRFLPGTILGDRFRIVAMLGRGGMGEVFRADDLKLGQPVALKFLPRSFATDPQRADRLFAEVRIARQISHPNVCRVYDVGEVDGERFISMEYIEGENVAALLRRIGRVSEQKGIQIARQIAAGLGAAHEKGVLHRDLKPSNIMLDERGLVRITDFGLAVLAEDAHAAQAIEGTPAYMAPEQLAGEPLSVRTDLYALGLVLYEIFTGAAAFDAESVADSLRERRASTPSAPSTLSADINPIVERVILHCLEPDPHHRPASALAVAGALPGGDALAAALAAGETPSPELLAATGDVGAMRVSNAVACLTLVVMGLAIFGVASRKTSIVSYVVPQMTADMLAVRAREIIKGAGLNPQAHNALGFDFDDAYLRHVEQNDNSKTRWERLRRTHPAAMLFWYRESPRPVMNFSPPGMGEGSPKNVEAITGMVTVRLDGKGHLRSISTPTPQLSEEGPARPIDWGPLFRAAGLDRARMQPAPSRWTPLSWGDTRAAWSGSSPAQPAVLLRVEAAGYQGKPVSFQVLPPWERPRRDVEPPRTQAERAGLIGLLVILFVIVAVAAVLARRNFRLGRGDRRGALRIAYAFFAVYATAWLFDADHVAAQDEIGVFLGAIAITTLIAAILWVLYMALEPYVRRRWPKNLISWNRLLRRDPRDPLVGRDVLIGMTTGVIVVALVHSIIAIAGIYTTPERPHSFDTDTLLGFRHAVATVLACAMLALVLALGRSVLLLILRIIVRRDALAAASFALIGGGLSATQANPAWIGFVTGAMTGAVVAVLFLRTGLLALIAYHFVWFLCDRIPIAPELSSWFVWTTILGLTTVIGLALYAFRLTLAGRPLLSEALLET